MISGGSSLGGRVELVADLAGPDDDPVAGMDGWLGEVGSVGPGTDLAGPDDDPVAGVDGWLGEVGSVRHGTHLAGPDDDPVAGVDGWLGEVRSVRHGTHLAGSDDDPVAGVDGRLATPLGRPSLQLVPSNADGHRAQDIIRAHPVLMLCEETNTRQLRHTDTSHASITCRERSETQPNAGSFDT